MRFTIGRDTINDPYHIGIIKDKLMRSLAVVLPDVIDELSVAVPEYICPPKDDGAFLCRLNAPLYIHMLCVQSLSGSRWTY